MAIKNLKGSFAGDKLKADIRDQIEKLILKPGDCLLSTEELARTYKISYVIAHRAITDLVEEGFLIRHQGRGTFVVSKKSENTKISSNNIGCLFRWIQEKRPDDNYFLEIFQGVEEEISSHNYFMIYKKMEKDNTKNTFLVKELIKANVAGLLLDEWVSDDLIQKVLQNNIPLVLVNRNSEIKNVSCVFPDNSFDVLQAIEYLRAGGHKRILFSYELKDPNQIERMEAFKLYSQKFDISYKIIPAQEKDFSGKVYQEAIHEGLKFKPTVILVGVDWIASNAYIQLKSEGLRIPEDISIISICDLDLASQLSPPLTTIRINAKEIGRESINQLMRLIKNEDKNPRKIKMQGQLIERKSCQ